MSGVVTNFTTHLSINDITIEVTTDVNESFQEVRYSLKATKSMEPAVVAIALYLMCHDICGKMNIEVDELAEGLVDSNSELH